MHARIKKRPRSFPAECKAKKHGLCALIVTRRPRSRQAPGLVRGLLRAGPLTLSCSLGQAGIQHVKKEGDKATPAGRFAVLYGFFRADRGGRPASLLPMRSIHPADGWCDDPLSPAYNRRVPLPFLASHEKLWRGDALYDLVIVLDYNLSRRCKNRGSAIFLHCARDNFAPTEGCIALSAKDLRKLLPRLSRRPALIIR